MLGTGQQPTRTSINLISESRKIEFVAAHTQVDIVAAPLWGAAVVLFFSGLVSDFGTVPLVALMIWYGLILIWSLIAFIAFVNYKRRDQDPAAIQFWSRTFVILYIYAGTIWGSTAWLLWLEGVTANNLMLIVIALGTSVSFGTQYTHHFKIFLAASLPLHILFFARYVTDPSAIGTIFSVLGPAFSVWMIANGRKSYQIFAKSLETQIENEEMAGRLGSIQEGLEAQVTIRTKQLERELEWRKDAQDQLRDAKEQAEAANRAKSAFLSSMSHELRTPLNAVLGFGQLLESDPIVTADEARKTGVDQILKGGHHLLALIDEVLDLSKIEGGRLTLSIEIMEPAKAINDCLSMVASSADENQVTLVDNTCDVKMPAIKADYTRFKQVLINLLSNGIKYSGRDSTVTLNAVKAGQNFLRISVTDDGPGIAADQQRHIFEPFNRLGAESSEIEGTGIGLTITKRLMESMNGQIGFESSEGHGTTFWIEYPNAEGFELGDAPSGGKSSLPSGVSKNSQEDTRTVLYVEDNPSNIQVMKQMVSELPNLTLVAAQDAKSAFQLIEKKKPDVVFMDIHLPGISGIEAMEHLRKSTETQNIPVIAISASAMPKEIERGLAAGFERYLTKPLLLPEVLGAIEDNLIT